MEALYPPLQTLLMHGEHALSTSSDAFQAGKKASELVERAWEVFGDPAWIASEQ